MEQCTFDCVIQKGTINEDDESEDGPRRCKFLPIGTVTSYLNGSQVADTLSIILLVLVISPSMIVREPKLFLILNIISLYALATGFRISHCRSANNWRPFGDWR